MSIGKKFKGTQDFTRFPKGQILKILVYEHVSGGGYAGQPIDLSVLSEGYAMLRCLVADLKAAGHEISVLLDARISTLNPPLAADRIIPVFNEGDAKKSLKRVAKINDVVKVIAPEAAQTLESQVLIVAKSGASSLNCEPSAIHSVADKTVLCQTLLETGLHIPKTLFFDFSVALADVKSAVNNHLSYPLVFKPTDGVSCCGLSLVKEKNQAESALAKMRTQSSGRRFVVQEFIRGEDVSVSLLCTNKEILPLSLNKQIVKLAGPGAVSSYVGGLVPCDVALKHEAFNTAKKVAALFPGLLGYVGVDLVLKDNKAFVLDVNPRLTTSYVGLSRVAGFNVAEAMIDAVLNGKPSPRPQYTGYAWFSKVESPQPTFNVFQKACRASGVVSPPFKVGGEAKSVSLVAACGESAAEAEVQFEEAKKRLLETISGGK